MDSASAAGSLMANKEEFDHVFSDVELQQFLEKVANTGCPQDDCEGDSNLYNFLSADNAAIPLQFLPPEHAPSNSVPSSAMSSYDGLPAMGLASHQASTAQQMSVLSATGAPPVVDLPGLFGQSRPRLMQPTSLPLPPPAVQAVPPLPPAVAGMSQQQLSSFAFAAHQQQRGRAGAAMLDTKPQVSHSTVEKQRRDRINSLIDELRELVPPSKATLAASAAANGGGASAKDLNSEARRPKHVVLADTIALLKQLQTRAPLAALLSGQVIPVQPSPVRANSFATPQRAAGDAPQLSAAVSGGLVTAASGGMSGVVKAEAQGATARSQSPSNSNSKGSVSSQDDCEMRDETRSNAPQLPHIPIQPTQLAGVVVEKGPDCMYVQVKCRDRKGLLSDIINAMKVLPLEVRTAAVTTQPDGLVRDVFEVCVDDALLQPEQVQNMVHEALFQQYAMPHHEHGKRARS